MLHGAAQSKGFSGSLQNPIVGCCVGAGVIVGAIEGKSGAAMPGHALPSLLLVSADCATHLREKERPVWAVPPSPHETWVLPGTLGSPLFQQPSRPSGRGIPPVWNPFPGNLTHCLISTQDTTGRDDDLEEAQPGVVAEEEARRLRD